MSRWVLPLVVVYLQMALSQLPLSPCPDVYRYEQDSYGIYAAITVYNPPPLGTDMKLSIRLSVGVQLNKSHKGALQLYDDNKTVAQRIKQGGPIYYKLFFPPSVPVPNVVSVNFNGRILCSGPPAYGDWVTTLDIYLTTRLVAPDRTYLVYNPYQPNTYYTEAPTNYQHVQPQTTQKPIQITESPRFVQDYPEQTTSTTTPSYTYQTRAPTNYLDSVCGISPQTLTLITNGNKTSKGDWPWLVALFHTKRTMPGEIKKEFKCGGSLISKKAVVTAAHCVTDGTFTLKEDSILLKLGAFDIDDEGEESAVQRGVTQIRIRDDYGENHENDIALLIMRSSVMFTTFIRPVCLWRGPSDKSIVYGRDGMVIGWGKDERGASVTPHPRQVSVPIVSLDECKASSEILHAIVSDSVLCAGRKDGSGPCTGDSGGGLYLRQGSRWVIRGIVSEATKDWDTNSCNLRDFVIYTDLAKYLPWLQGA